MGALDTKASRKMQDTAQTLQMPMDTRRPNLSKVKPVNILAAVRHREPMLMDAATISGLRP